ncbi:MAG: Exo-glucosaminidase LytG precursor [Bacteroidetes bacterium ADurb.Bin139]|nr:MAG: Exo-glucosaminidase LytG precursor [Bacteroidetes bacterium ADurb.Bin139]
MLNPCLYKAFCFVSCLLPLSVPTWAFPLSHQREETISREQYIDTYKGIAVAQMHRYGIPASIILAQGCLESGNGNSRLAREANNHFGIKCHDWEGDRIYHDDDALQECFRKYKTAEDSYYDHSEFLRNRPRYANLFLLERTDYTSWANGLKEAGYATNPRYARLLIDLIEQYGLHRFDLIAPQDTTAEQIPRVQPALLLYDFTEGDVFSIDVERRILKTNGKRYILSAPGDTYRSLAAEYRLFLGELTRYNDVAKDADLAAGEKVYLQRKAGRGASELAFWSSVPGESLADISQRFGIRLQALRKLNPGVTDNPTAGTVVRLR